MNEAMEFLFSLALKGIKLSVEGHKLNCYAREGLLTDEIKSGIVQHKAHLIQLLKARNELQVSSTEVPGSREFLLSVGQKGLYILQKLDPEFSGYNVPICFRTKNKIDMPTLQRAWGYVLDQYPILTARIVEKNDNLHHCLDERCRTTVQERTIGMEDDQEAIQLLQKEARKPFDVNSGPLTRVVLYSRDDGEVYLLLTVHHIIFDGTSAVIVMKSLVHYYQRLSSGQAVTLATDLVGYQDFVAWEKAMLASAEGKEHAEYWQRQLSGELAPFELPMDQPRLEPAKFEAKTLITTLPARLAYWAHGCSKIHSVPLSVIFLSVFQLLLHKYTGDDDTLVTMPVMGRVAGKFAKEVGYFVNMVPLRSRSFEGVGFGEFLRSVHTTMLDALYHSSYPFPLILSGVELRQASRNAAFEVSFAYQDLLNAIAPAAFDAERVAEVAQEADSDLGLEIVEDGASFRLHLKYNKGVYALETVRRLFQHYVSLLEAISDDPNRVVGAYCIVTERERRRLLEDFNATEADYPRDKCIHELFVERVRLNPNKTAVVFGEQALSYQELFDRSRDLALYLQSQGVKPDCLVGLCTERSLDMIVGLLGILLAGGAYVPLDPAYPDERLAHMLEDSQAAIVLTQARLKEKLGALPTQEARLIALDEEWPQIAALDVSRGTGCELRREVEPHHLAYVIYTSGSTAKPKGVMVEHRSLVNHNSYVRKQYAITDKDIQVLFSSMSFDLFVEEVFSILVSGAQLIVEQKDNLLSLQSFEQMLRSHKITALNVPTSFFHRIAASNPRLGAVEKVIVGGDKLSYARAREFIDQFPDIRLHNTYGPTETTIISTAVSVTEDLVARHHFVPIGRPIANTQIYILDRRCNIQPIGVAGELHIAGDGLARGYLNRPLLTQEKFIANPFVRGGRMYKTGDQARWLEDGTIEYLGRIDTQVKIRGFRIELGEIESLLGRHPEIADCLVVAQDHEADQQLVAFYRAKGSTTDQIVQLAQEDLRRYLRLALPDYMIPAAFVSLAAMPLTPGGKADRRALERLDVNFESSQQYLGPRTDAERELVDIWAQVLNIESGKIGVNDNFFELGGHSLLATAVISKIRNVFDMDLPLKSLFDVGTLAGLAEVITAMEDGQAVDVAVAELEDVSL